MDETSPRSNVAKGHTLGAVVLILKDTGSALGFVMLRERFTFCVKGPSLEGVASVRKKYKCGEKYARLKPIELLGWRVTDMVCGRVRRREGGWSLAG